MDLHLSHACRRYATQSSTSFFDRQLSRRTGGAGGRISTAIPQSVPTGLALRHFCRRSDVHLTEATEARPAPRGGVIDQSSSPRRTRARAMVLYDSLPRPRRSITSAAARADRCDSSFRTGSSSASRAAAAAAFFAASLLTEGPSFLPRALAAPRHMYDGSPARG
jgi:hypothetical protein